MVYTKQQWFTPAEVSIHNRADDCWVSLNGKVLDLTSFLAQQFRLCHCKKWCSCPVKSWYCADDCVEYCPCFKRGYLYCDARRLAMTILAYAGKDLSHWFNGSDWITYVHPIVGSVTTYHLHGHELTRPVVPSTKWRPFDANPWWMNEKLVIGNLTAKTRPITITNTHTSPRQPIFHNSPSSPASSVTLEVCSEETIYQIMLRYLKHNSHMLSYTFRHMGRTLNYGKTLEENGIPDERETYNQLGLPENHYIPSILVYYNDDLTEDPPTDYCYCQRDDMCMSNRPGNLCLIDGGGPLP